VTIAISLKVNDGVVLATDSAATILAKQPDQPIPVVLNVYNNADKLFNLYKGLPIGAITWGSGSIGASSITTLMKDFRKKLKAELNRDSFTIEQISNELSKYVFSNYEKAFKEWPNKPPIGFMVGGYSFGSDFPEEWKIDIIEGKIVGPEKVRGENQVGLTWNGEPEAITRLYFGISGGTGPALMEMGFDEKRAREIMEGLKNRLSIPMVIPPMPIQDAIDLVQFLVETTMKFSKFSPGATTVGGPIDIAAITKHEGFKWIRRKYYFHSNLNPLEEE
jgi:hypothetical protein